MEFVTPGILLRRVLRDPELTGTAAVVLDEVHERGVESDLLVGMLVELRQLRDDLVLVAMSATVEAERFAALLGGDAPAPVVDCRRPCTRSRSSGRRARSASTSGASRPRSWLT
ncbi:hypothetical protein ACJ65_10870, partial [Kocuria rhizophila]